MRAKNRLFAAALLGAVTLGATPATQASRQPAFAPAIVLGSDRLAMRGSGTTYYARLFPVYDAALYAPAGTEVLELVEGTAPRCLLIEYQRPVARDLIVTAADRVLQRQGVALGPLQNRLERLNAAYRDVDAGDRYQLCHAPGADTRLALNGEELIRIPGDDFAVAYFGIWLRDGAISEELRSALLSALPSRAS
jgi:hypothetical protein